MNLSVENRVYLGRVSLGLVQLERILLARWNRAASSWHVIIVTRGSGCQFSRKKALGNTWMAPYECVQYNFFSIAIVKKCNQLKTEGWTRRKQITTRTNKFRTINWAFTVTSHAMSRGRLESLVSKTFAAGGLCVYFAGINPWFTHTQAVNNLLWKKWLAHIANQFPIWLAICNFWLALFFNTYPCVSSM